MTAAPRPQFPALDGIDVYLVAGAVTARGGPAVGEAPRTTAFDNDQQCLTPTWSTTLLAETYPRTDIARPLYGLNPSPLTTNQRLVA